MPAHQPPSFETPRGQRRRRARALAGARREARAALAAGRRSASERGTVLLMVLGVLALMAIIAVVYAAIGKGDRVASAATVRNQRIEDQVDQIADYFASAIGRDVFATYAQEDDRLLNGDSRGTARLEAFDAPATDVMMVSQRDDTDAEWDKKQRDGFYLFNPEGSYSRSWRSLQLLPTDRPKRRDPRSPSDPYLAATEPTFINRNAPDWRWQPYVTASNLAGEDYLRARDWSHISNLAPSGNFVNLHHLRNNFRAESGFGEDGSRKPRLSTQLTLIDPGTGAPYRAGPVDQDPNVDFTTMRRGWLGKINNLTLQARLNRPADWTENQLGMYRTAADEASPDRNASPPRYGVDDLEYLPYQWADADGDGFYDSRWFELVDISDPARSRPVIAAGGRARLFMAARAVDLTALLNVNTACDMQFEPRRTYFQTDPADPLKPFSAAGAAQQRIINERSYLLPVGLTPADVDLQRLLRLTDAGNSLRKPNSPNLPAGYTDLPQPPANASIGGDYTAYDPNTQVNNLPRNQAIGNASYQALWEARVRNGIANDRRMLSPMLPDPANLNGNYAFNNYTKQAANRLSFYENSAVRQGPGRLGGGGTLNRYGATFDEADELELRTFQGLNDPSRTSRLEAVMMGRINNDPNSYTLSPLRSDRPSSLERAGRDLPQPANILTAALQQTDEYRRALLSVQLDVRRLLTTISGARPIIDNPLVTVRTDERGNIVDAPPASFASQSEPLSQESRTGVQEARPLNLKVDGARLVSRLVETGNYRYLNVPPAGMTPSNCTQTAFASMEEQWDNLGYDDHVVDRDDLWLDHALNNLLPPYNPATRAPMVFPPTGRVERGDKENYVESRLDLMREAFRAYADCLMPYTQFGTDPARLNVLNGPFPHAWWERNASPKDLFGNRLAYGGNPELAYLMAAHMAVNLRDMLDTDRKSDVNDLLLVQDAHIPTAVTLDMTPQALDELSSNLTPPARRVDPQFPWPKLNLDNRFDRSDDSIARTRLPHDRDSIVSATSNPDGATGGGPDVKREVIFGIEPQPFISQVSSMAFFVDTPCSFLTPCNGEDGDPDDEAAGGGVNPEVTINVRGRIHVGSQPVALTAANVRNKANHGNADFLCYLIAFQVTNPFDTDINLDTPDPTKNDAYYYFEHAGRSYRLVEDDATMADGMHRATGTNDPTRVLKAGQTKTFYATFPSSLSDIDWRFSLVQSSIAQSGSVVPHVGQFASIARHEFGDDCVHVACMDPRTGYALRASGATRLPDIDLFARNNVTETGAEDNAFPAVLKTFSETQIATVEGEVGSDCRLVTYLWRALPAPATLANPTGRTVPMLLDRLHDPTDPEAVRNHQPISGSLMSALIDPWGTGNLQKEVSGADALDDSNQKGYSFISWASITRPTNPERPVATTDPAGSVPTGAMPPWCIETKADNIFLPGVFSKPTNQNTDERHWSLNRIRGNLDDHGFPGNDKFTLSSNWYHPHLSDLVTAHKDSATRFVDGNLRQKFADRRGAQDKRIQTNRFLREHSIALLDELRATAGNGHTFNSESDWFGDMKPRRFEEAAIEVHHLADDLTGSVVGATPTGVSPSSSTAVRTTPPRALFSRVGDFLLPLAVGPSFDPYRRAADLPGAPSSVHSRTQNLDAQWTTLSEALALAMDYYSGPKSFDVAQDPFVGGQTSGNIPLGDAPNLYYKFGHDTRNRLKPDDVEFSIPKAERGQLVLDAWAPYLTYHVAGPTDEYTWARLNPSDNASLRAVRDAPIGNGIPLALNILDKFRVAGLPAETQPKPSDIRLCINSPANGFPGEPWVHVGNTFASVGRSTAYGSATQLVPGLININTAPQAVLRLLPMVAPTTDLLNAPNSPGDITTKDSWLNDGRFQDDKQSLVAAYALPSTLTTANPRIPTNAPKRLWDPDPSNRDTYEPWDLAATISGYRDQTAVDTRAFGAGVPISVNYRDDRTGATLPTRSGRDDAFGISSLDRAQGGLRDGRGFKSVGEIMALVMNRSTDPAVKVRAMSEGRVDPANPSQAIPLDHGNSITRLGLDGASTLSPAILSTTYKKDRSKELTTNANTVLDDAPSQVPDSYEEKLAIANALLNTITVRSDVFCIWFIVNGYAPEDVLVDAGSPMVPSIARRYMMVVDRSNVDSPTAKPKIVMLREVPMP